MIGVLRKMSKLSKTFIGFSAFSSSQRYYGDMMDFNLNAKKIYNSSRLDAFINQYRKNGHHFAKLDPLNLH